MGYGSGWKGNQREVWHRDPYTDSWYQTYESLPRGAKGDGKGGKPSGKSHGDHYQDGKRPLQQAEASADGYGQVKTVTVYHCGPDEREKELFEIKSERPGTFPERPETLTKSFN